MNAPAAGGGEGEAAGSPRAGPGLLASPEHVLSTLEADGRRRWLRPRLSPGRFLSARRAVGWGLIALFVTLPHLRWAGKPPLLLDVVAREFTVLGTTFGATETPILMVLLLAAFFTVFLFTALLGRVWCGWGCPQTVYMEHLFRPLERLFEGSPQDQRRLDAEGPNLARLAKNVVFVGISFLLANTFLAYFVGTDRLLTWVVHSPAEHPAAFALVLAVTALMAFDFGWFREQTCLVACPYGRFQSVLLDRQSLLVGYDRTRGEPRGKPGKARPLPAAAPAASGAAAVEASPADAGAPAAAVLEAPAPGAAAPAGDCIDCGACVVTCPTGIDIRNGLQMECIGCAQCIDACDAIMDRVGKPRGLVRYASQADLDRQPRRLLRARVLAYSVLIGGLLLGLAALLTGREPIEVTLLRPAGTPFLTRADGKVQVQVRVKLFNREAEARDVRLSLVGPDGAPLPGVELVVAQDPLHLAGRAMLEMSVFAIVPPERFVAGRLPAQLRFTAGEGFSTERPAVLLGPAAAPGPANGGAR